jgi:hypothetical protein
LVSANAGKAAAVARATAAAAVVVRFMVVSFGLRSRHRASRGRSREMGKIAY